MRVALKYEINNISYMRVIGFYAAWNDASIVEINNFGAYISELKYVTFDSIDIDNNKDKWNMYGLKTIPSIVITRNEKCICFFAGKLNFDEIKKQLVYLKTLKDPETEYKIKDFIIKDSSSCHRYDRWNEQFLLSDLRDNGWSSVSSKESNTAYLIIDMFKTHKVSMIGLRPREWELNADLKDSFPDKVDIYISDNEVDWHLVDCYNNIDKPGINGLLFRLRMTKGRFLKLIFTVFKLRKEKKYFIQLSGLDLYGHFDEEIENMPLSPSFGATINETKYIKEVANKQGIFTGDNVATEVWYLNQEQTIGERIYYISKVLIIPLVGDIDICWGNKSQRINNMHWVIIPPHCIHSIENNGNSRACFLEIRDNVPSLSAWSNRR